MDQSLERKLRIAVRVNDNREVGRILKTRGLENPQILHDAVLFSSQQVVETILKYTSIDIKNGNGATPLNTAVRHKKYEMAKFLIEKGADVNAENDKGLKIIHEVVINIQLIVIDELFNNFRLTGSINGIMASYLRMISLETFKFAEYLLNHPKIDKSKNVTEGKRDEIRERVESAYQIEIMDIANDYGMDVANYLQQQFYRIDIWWN